MERFSTMEADLFSLDHGVLIGSCEKGIFID